MTSALLLSQRALFIAFIMFRSSACIAPKKKIATTATATAAATNQRERMMIASFIPSIHLTLQFTMNFSAVKFNFCVFIVWYSF